jgi:geranylgeranyl diphosphate synthase type I
MYPPSSHELDDARSRRNAESDRTYPGLLSSDQGLAETENLMLRLARGRTVDRMTQMVTHHLAAGGKRFRARLALAATEALGEERDRAIAWAAAVELLHNASLIHDDIQDGDSVRRDRPALWAEYGKAQAINAGDLLLMLPFIAVGEAPIESEARGHLVSILARRAARTVRGQVQELSMLQERRLSPADYLDTVGKKTGELLALPVEGATIIAGRRPERARALADPFIDLGTLFQLQDDLIDLYGDKGRGRAGSDLYNGKVTALVVAHLALYPFDTDWLVDLLQRPAAHTPDREVAEAAERFARPGGALDYAISVIRRITERTARSDLLASEPGLHALALELCERATRSISGLIDSRTDESRVAAASPAPAMGG